MVFENVVYCFMGMDRNLVGKVVYEYIGVNQIHLQSAPLIANALNFFFQVSDANESTEV